MDTKYVTLIRRTDARMWKEAEIAGINNGLRRIGHPSLVCGHEDFPTTIVVVESGIIDEISRIVDSFVRHYRIEVVDVDIINETSNMIKHVCWPVLGPQQQK